MPTPLYNQILEWGWVKPLSFGSLDLGPANKSIWEGAKGSRQSLAKMFSYLSSICFQLMPRDMEEFAGWSQEDMVFLWWSLIFVSFLWVSEHFNPSRESSALVTASVQNDRCLKGNFLWIHSLGFEKMLVYISRLTLSHSNVVLVLTCQVINIQVSSSLFLSGIIFNQLP